MSLRVREALVRGPGEVSRELSEFGIDDMLAYELHSYRDACTARGLDRPTRSEPDEAGPIAVLYGRLHPGVIIAYLRRPAIKRDLKAGLYLPFALLGNQATREYAFIGQEWVLTKRQAY